MSWKLALTYSCLLTAFFSATASAGRFKVRLLVVTDVIDNATGFLEGHSLLLNLDTDTTFTEFTEMVYNGVGLTSSEKECASLYTITPNPSAPFYPGVSSSRSVTIYQPMLTKITSIKSLENMYSTCLKGEWCTRNYNADGSCVCSAGETVFVVDPQQQKLQKFASAHLAWTMGSWLASEPSKEAGEAVSLRPVH